ncbi:hypothetical protein HK103_003395 [Boothiomyces macroporosus]|uniref:Uncharacterized protein n=1 Tax=Boothiomyces macroporosus TaxID=261099 RepID=A0AAD5UC30_9FUNG|nr:hypothetical protein HK103_003395 [Boothiomyces macroporosus]
MFILAVSILLASIKADNALGGKTVPCSWTGHCENDTGCNSYNDCFGDLVCQHYSYQAWSEDNKLSSGSQTWCTPPSKCQTATYPYSHGMWELDCLNH